MDKKNLTEKEIETIVNDVAKILDEKRALDIEIMHVRDLTSIADYFIVCTGTSNTHLKTLSEEVERLMEEKYQMRPHHIEGYETASWILADYGFMVVHAFHRDQRQFYSLERLWSDAPKNTFTEKK